VTLTCAPSSCPCFHHSHTCAVEPLNLSAVPVIGSRTVRVTLVGLTSRHPEMGESVLVTPCTDTGRIHRSSGGLGRSCSGHTLHGMLVVIPVEIESVYESKGGLFWSHPGCRIGSASQEGRQPVRHVRNASKQTRQEDGIVPAWCCCTCVWCPRFLQAPS
jgi:hypothetical protein